MAPLVILLLFLAYSDILYTRFMLGRHGVAIELNPVIQWLVPALGLTYGVYFGIAVPTLTLLYLGLYFRPILDVLVFARLMLFFLQAKRLRVEFALIPQRSRSVNR